MTRAMIKATVAFIALCGFGMNQAVAQGFSLPQMKVTSEAFEDGGIVPMKYVSTFAGGDNVQPDFSITNAPDSTVSYAIIFHDLDVALEKGTTDVLHWLAWNIPTGEIPEGSLPDGSVTGSNLMGQNVYFGPGAPPGDRYHHYLFEFYALDSDLDLPESAGREELLEAMEGKVVAKAAYVGRFKGQERD